MRHLQQATAHFEDFDWDLIDEFLLTIHTLVTTTGELLRVGFLTLFATTRELLRVDFPLHLSLFLLSSIVDYSKPNLLASWQIKGAIGFEKIARVYPDNEI